MYKWASYIMVFCVTTVAYGFTYLHTQGHKKQWVIVIDPGHGGKDPGCHGKKFREKNVALAVSLKLGHYIEENDKDVKVVFTRTTDVFVPLNERAEIANKNHADLFICVHCNASPNHEAYGSATYVMGLKKSEGNLEVEKRENSSILYEKDYKKTYDGFDPNSPEGTIIFSMYQNIYLAQSLDLSAKIENEYAHQADRKVNGVKQAGFLVLWRTAMPSLLTEIGFLTNPQEEKFLGSQKGEDEIAKSIFLAFEQYKAEKDNSTYDPKSFTFKPLEVQNPDLAKTDSTGQPPVSQQDSTATIKQADTDSTGTDTAATADTAEPVKLPPPEKDIVKKTNKKPGKDSKHEPVTDTASVTPKHVAVNDSTEKKVDNMRDAVNKLRQDTVATHKKFADSIAAAKKIIPVHNKPADTTSTVKKPIVTKPKKTTDSIAIAKKIMPTPKKVADTTNTVKKIVVTKPKKTADSVAIAKKIMPTAKKAADTTSTIKKTVVNKPKKTADSVATAKKVIAKKTEPAKVNDKVVYKVQFLLSSHELKKDDAHFQGIPKLGMYIDNSTYKYTAGEFDNVKDAVALAKKLRTQGYKDAFVVAFIDGKRVTIKQAEGK